MATTLLLSGLILAFPALTLYSEKKYRIIRWIGAVVICYLTGMIAGNLPGLRINTSFFNTVSEVSVSLAIPALLFSVNLKNSWRNTRTAILSFGLCAVAVSISAVLGWYFLGHYTEESWKISGMLIGVYTGGTPNMSAIGKALGVKDEVFILINSIDIMLSGFYFLFLITISRRVLGCFLPKTTAQTDQIFKGEEISFSALPLRVKFKNILTSTGLSALILAIAAGISFMITGTLSAPLVILVLTTLGIGASFIPSVNKLEGSYQTAHYLLLIFALSIGVLADFSTMLAGGSLVFLYCTFVMSGAILLHYIMAAFFRIDTDTVIITSVAAIFGPAFIGPVANSLHNRQIIVAGISTGMLGYAIGNYLGIAIAWLLQ